MKLVGVFVLGFLQLALCGAEPAPQPDWPVAPVVPDKMPPAPAIPVVTLPGDSLYVVQSDEAVQLLSSPPGIVTITEEAGPLRVRGKFVDSLGRTETRTYGKKQVFIIERVAPGNFELLMVPKGKVDRRLITDGEPIPPPKPKPPTPDPPAPLSSFRVIFVVESGDNLTVAQQGVIYGKVVEDWLIAHCSGGKAGFRRRDRDNPNLTGDLKAIWDASRPLVMKTPCVVVERNTHIEIIDVEANPAKMVAVFQEYFDGKRGGK